MRTQAPQIPFLDLAAQNQPLRAQIDAAMSAVIDANAFILGPALGAFEKRFAEYCESRTCVGVSSGLEAIQIALQASGIGPGDEVITVPNTFVATVEAIARVGATAVLADVDPRTWLMDPAAVEARITPRTAALLPVHLYGFPADLVALRSLALRHGLTLIEDAAQAHGARLHGKRIGNGSRAAAFSFYPGKNLGAFGDGGAVVTDDPELAATMVALRHHGQREKNVHSLVGTTARLDSLQAAVLEIKLAHLDKWNSRRREHAARYRERLAGSRYTFPATLEGAEPVFHLFVVNHPEVSRVKSGLTEAGIGWGEHYPKAVHLHPAFSQLGRAGEFPVAERICANIISLPMFAELEPGMVDRVCEALLALDRP
jgi:dTDP-3-amino-3,4,6-trideoxy-alpha-D-glucose transaminase